MVSLESTNRQRKQKMKHSKTKKISSWSRLLGAFLICASLCWPANVAAGQSTECSWSTFAALNGTQMKKHLVHFEPLQAPCCDRNLRLDGTISVRVAFDRNGQVVCAQAIDGHPLAVQAAMTSVRLWKFSPYLHKGVPVDASGTVKVLYRLRSEGSSSEVVGWSPRKSKPTAQPTATTQ